MLSTSRVIGRAFVRLVDISLREGLADHVLKQLHPHGYRPVVGADHVGRHDDYSDDFSTSRYSF